MDEITNPEVSRQYEYNGMVMTGDLFPLSVLKRIDSFQFKPSDTLIATYPKCGTTWMQEIVRVMTNKLNFEEAKQTPTRDAVKFLENHKQGDIPEIDKLKAEEEPRLIKTHLDTRFLGKRLSENLTQHKTIVVSRNPKDCLVSYYHMYKAHPAFGPFLGTWDQFYSLCLNKRLVYGDYFDFYTSWWHVAVQYPDSVLFMKYENMQQNPRDAISKVAAFLGKILTDEQLDAIVAYTDFGAMKANPMCNPATQIDSGAFFRKGVVGDWKNYFSKKQSKHMDELCKTRLETVGLDVNTL